MNLKKSEKIWFIWVRSLIIGAIFCLIFENIPKCLQLGVVSNGFSSQFSWYFLFALMILWIYQQSSCDYEKHLEKKDFLYIKYILGLMVILLISNVWGLITFPYYDELLSGPNNQIEKLPIVLAWSNSHDISIDEKYLTMIWVGVRAVKGTIFSLIYTFGFSFILYQFFKKDWDFYFNLITKVVIASITLLCVYSVIELFSLAGFDFAKNILSIINPMIHPIAVDHGWWPPLLWKGQLRSLFSEPARMGNYLAFALPFLWGRFLLSSQKSIGLIILITFYTFMIFMTKARTAVAMYWGVLFLLFLGIILIHKKKLIKKFFCLCVLTVLSLGLSIGFINVVMTGTTSEPQQMTIASYLGDIASCLEDNVGSLGSANKRSNGARYALIRANMKTGLEHPVWGVGNILGSAYTVHNFNDADLANNEVHLWVTNYYKEGPLRYGLDAINEYVSRFAYNGILGLISFLFPLGYILFRVIECFRLTEGREQLKILIVGISLIGSAVVGFNGSLTTLYAYWVILAFSYAMVYGICKEKNME